MAVLNQLDMTLASATFANGAQLLSAGGGLPARIGPETEYQFDLPLATSSICFAANDRDIWACQSNVLRKFNFAGTQLSTRAATAAWSLSRLDADQLLIGRISTSAFYNYVESTDTLTSRATPTAVRSVWPGPTGSGLAWYTAQATVATEVTEATGAATGRTLTTGTQTNMFSSEADGVWGLYISTANTITKYEDVAGTMTAVKTWTTLVGAAPNPGAVFGSEFIIDPTGRPIIKTGSGHLDRWNLAGGAMLNIAERAVWPNADLGGPVSFSPGGGNQRAPAVAFSADGRYFAMLVSSADGLSYDKAIRVKNTFIQTASWDISAATEARTLTRIVVPGHLGDQYGLTAGWRAGTVQDFRRARLYYSVDGGARVEFAQGQPLSVAIALGQTLRVDVDFNMGLGMLAGAAPYVGGDNGEGPSIFYTTADPPSGGGDTTPPVLTVTHTPATSQEFWECSVYDLVPGLELVQVLVTLDTSNPNAPRYAALDGGAMQWPFKVSSTIAGAGTQADPYLIRIRPDGGWPAGQDHRTIARFIDGDGNPVV